MKITFVIAEYNPLHSGHLFQLRAAKEETDAQKLVVIMSGSITERGDFAVADRKTRAAWAALAGADAVIELPVCHSVANAEIFSEGALKIIGCFSGHDLTLSFGSECGDLSLLQRAAEAVGNETDGFKQHLKDNLKLGMSFPLARHKALADTHPQVAEVLSAPNNILAVEYIKAAKKLGLNINFHTVKRQNDYNSALLGGDFASATAIREALFSGKRENVRPYLPTYVYDTLSPAYTDKNLSALVLYGVSGKSKAELENLPDVSEGLENRLKSAADKSADYASLVENVKTKRFTMARIKRVLVYTLLGIDKATLKKLTAAEPYCNMLESDAELLKILAANNRQFVVRGKDVENLDETQAESFRLNEYAAKIRDIVYP